MSQGVTFLPSLTNDHHTKEGTDSTTTPRHPTTNPTTTPKAYKRTQCPTQPPTNDDRSPRRKMGRMPRNDTIRPPSRPRTRTGVRKHCQLRPHHHARSTMAFTTGKLQASPLATSVTTSYERQTLDNGHHHRQDTSTAHHDWLQTANPQTTTERSPPTQESPPATWSAHPSYPRTTMGVRKCRQQPHHYAQSKTATTARKRRMPPTPNNE